MIITGIEIYQGQRYPLFYAPAYRDLCRDVVIAYLFPLNLIVRWARGAYYAINAINPERLWENPYYKEGYANGHQQARMDIADGRISPLY